LSKISCKLKNQPTRKDTSSGAFSCLGDLLAYQARTATDRIAILGPERWSMTYGALWSSSDDTLRRLRSIGVSRTDRVAVVLPNGPETAMTIVAVAVGAVCVPLNPQFTADECRRYFAELGLAALLTRRDLASASRDVAQTFGIPVIELARRREPAGMSRIKEVETQCIVTDELASGADDAFILLTSGNTSRPKMVPLTHASVCLSAYNAGAALALGPDDRLLNVLPLFHAHGLISGTLATLAAGSSVVCTRGFNADAFLGWLTEFGATWYTAVPAIHQAVFSAADRYKHIAQRSSLRLIRSASSTLPPKLLCGLEAVFGVPVIDTYGMTESASQIAANPLGRRKVGSVGQAAGPEIAIVDGEGRPLSSGERGEIVLRGPTITRGYENDAAETAAAFRDGWFRTGDLGYLDSEGYLFIVGRIKDVINRGGQKVAPAEVEEVLVNHPDVVEAAVFPVPHPRLETDVAAAVVLRADAKITVQNLRRFARERLASFKVPGLIRIIEEIPKGAGGKIKRGELAATLSRWAECRGRMAMPRSDLERQLAQLWADLLQLKQISINQDVFALGADSIVVTQLISHLRARFGVELSFSDILGAPTVAALAACVKSSKRRPSSLSLHDLARDVACAEGNTALSIVQERILRIESEVPGLPQFNLSFAYRLRGALNVPALERSLAQVASRHASLRTGFTWLDGVPVARITPAADIKLPLIMDDISPCAENGNPRAKALLLRKVELEVEQESLKSFDISQAPLCRARLFRLGSDDHVLLLVVHDILIDGWSMEVFMHELSEFYAAFMASKQPQVPTPALQFSDFALRQRRWASSDAANRQFVYWKRRLRKAMPAFANKENDVGAELAAGIRHKRLYLSNDLVARLSDFSHSRRATLFMALLTGLKTLLLLRSGRNDICVATMMANRSQLGLERVIGPFANTTIIRTQLEADLTFQEAVNRVRDAVLEAYARQELPFDIIAERLAKEAGMDPASLTQVYFVLQVAFRRPVKLPNVTVRQFGYRQGLAFMPIDRTWLAMTLSETPSGIIGACRYKNDLVGPSTARHCIADYKAILAKAAANPKMTLGRLADA
jgi:acyl-CoA synthetase (AMP-forming)/AMP-acid ligase II/acyl carrier protein